MLGRPFAGAEAVAVVLPCHGDPLGDCGTEVLADLAIMLRRERLELELELGAPVRFVDDDPGSGPRWLIGPAACNPALARYACRGGDRPALWLDRDRHVLIVDAPDLDGIRETFSLLRSLSISDDDLVVAAECQDREQAIERIALEVGATYPSFQRYGLDWTAICARHGDRVRAAADPLIAMQEWLAELQDAHTWVKPRPAPLALPYSLQVTTERAVFARVPAGTAAWDAGVRPGDVLLDVATAAWCARTAAPPHARPLLTGHRLLAGPMGIERSFSVRTSRGDVRTWSETPTSTLPFPLVRWHRLHSGAGYLRIEAWRGGQDMGSAFDAALTELASTGRLIVDLRGNVGGNLTEALAFRDRFLRERTVLGSIRHSFENGQLSTAEPFAGEPSQQRRWSHPVRFLTDPLTYSASEDALLGLQGLPWVQVVGQQSGGGSGRPRTLRLLAGMMLTVSTALTFDRLGRCIEGAGIAVDLPATPDSFSPDAPDVVLITADRDW